MSRNAGVALGCAREREATRGADAGAGAEANVRSVDIMRVRGRRGAVECRRARRSKKALHGGAPPSVFTHEAAARMRQLQGCHWGSVCLKVLLLGIAITSVR